MKPAAVRSTPWVLGDIKLAYTGGVAAAVMLLVAWWGTSGSVELSTQVAWTSLGVAGIVLWGVVSTLWLVTGVQRVRALREDLVALDLVQASESEGRVRVGEARPDELVASASMTRYHRSDCLLVIDKDVVSASESDHRRAKRQPCGVCRP